MRVLHTSDWHVGRTIKGRSREDEHRAVLAEIAGIAAQENVDLVLVAGDIFDHAAPSPASEELVYEALLALTAGGRHVVTIAGNHDNGRRFNAVKPFLELARVHTLGEVAAPDAGGCLDLDLAGERARIALLPWVSQRGLVRAAELMHGDEASQQQAYQSGLHWLIQRLCAGFGSNTVNLLAGHVAITGATVAGGERDAGDPTRTETIFDYWVPPQYLPDAAQYCALGHIHRQQRIRGASSQAWYSGSPLQLDFGEKASQQGVLVFDARPGFPVGEVRFIPVRSGRPLLTVTGRLDEVLAQRGSVDANAYIRVVLDEPPRQGLADAVYSELPNAVEVKLVPRERAVAEHAIEQARGPHDLYAMYLAEAGIEDTAPLLSLFGAICEEVEHAATPA